MDWIRRITASSVYWITDATASTEVICGTHNTSKWYVYENSGNEGGNHMYRRPIGIVKKAIISFSRTARSIF